MQLNTKVKRDLALSIDYRITYDMKSNLLFSEHFGELRPYINIVFVSHSFRVDCGQRFEPLPFHQAHLRHEPKVKPSQITINTSLLVPKLN
jgi:hypothetical protein